MQPVSKPYQPSSSSMTSPSPLSSPPSRAVPPTPAHPAPPSSSTPPPDPLANPFLTVEETIDASTLSYLSSSFRSPFLPWLFRLVVFTSCSKLVRFFHPYFFHGARVIVSWLWWALEALVRWASFVALWGGLIAVAGWLVVGLAGGAVYGWLRAKPYWRGFARERPKAAGRVRKMGGYAVGWVVARKVLGRWGGRIVLVVGLGLEGWRFLQRPQAAQTAPLSSSSTSSATPASAQAQVAGAPAPAPAPAEGADDEELERWARKVKEEMLRDSLLRAGRKTAERPQEAEGGEAEEEDMPDLATGKGVEAEQRREDGEEGGGGGKVE
ncbi:hypothetical protein JCM8547_003898 [Rhodosporidiobolus lusitaniae]